MPTEKPVRIGIVGCGVIAQLRHIPDILRIKGAQIAAICERDSALLTRVGERLRTAKRYDDFSRMLSQEKLDIVDICTPPQTHYALSIEAAESGCHVLVEKPAALTVEEFDRIAETCTRNGVKLCQMQNKMFEPVMIAAVAQVKSGSVGDVISVNIQMLAKRAAEKARDPEHWCQGLPAGIFTEILPHPIYLAQAFLGAVEPVGVHLRNAGRDSRSTSDALKVVLEGKSGMGIIDYSSPSPREKVIIDVHGTRKNLYVDIWNSTSVEYGTGSASRASRASENLSRSFSLLACTVSTTLSVIAGRFRSGHYNVISSFVQSVRSGSEQPVSMEQAREVIRVMERITQMGAGKTAA
jgi:predicted dehydrogenase